MTKAIYEIKLLVETDDPAILDQLAAKVATAACDHDAHDEHKCATPWFIITSPVEDADEWRDLLNR